MTILHLIQKINNGQTGFLNFNFDESFVEPWSSEKHSLRNVVLGHRIVFYRYLMLNLVITMTIK